MKQLSIAGSWEEGGRRSVAQLSLSLGQWTRMGEWMDSEECCVVL